MKLTLQSINYSKQYAIPRITKNVLNVSNQEILLLFFIYISILVALIKARKYADVQPGDMISFLEKQAYLAKYVLYYMIYKTNIVI